MSGTEGYAWRVGGAAAEAAVGHTGNIGIGIIASLCSLRGRRHSLYAFATRPSPWTLVAGLASPAWVGLHYSRLQSGFCRALQGRMPSPIVGKPINLFRPAELS